MKKIFVAALAAAAALVSCNKQTEIVSASSEGCLTLGVNVEGATKAALSADQLLADARVNIYYADFSGMIRTYKYSETPATIYLPVDNYRVDVIAGEAAKAEPAAASWEQKSYKGSKEFAIKAGSNTSVEVLAKVNNAISKIAFDQTVAENFESGYTLTIGVGENTLVYDASKSGAEGYFIIAGLDEPRFDWTFSGKLAKDGSDFTKSGVIENIEGGKVYSMKLSYTIKDGEFTMDIYVDYSTEIIDDTIIFEPVSTGFSSPNIFEIWAGHATIRADVDATEYPDPSVVKFAFSSNGTDWTTVSPDNVSEGVYEAVLTGLQGSTEYTCKLVIAGEDVADPITFTTATATRVPNGGFEYYSKVSGKDYYKFYDPSCGVDEGKTMWWGSGNGEGSEGVNGSASMGIVITTIDTGHDGTGHSVLAQSGSTLGMLAAGNIFCGQFAGLVGTSGGKVNFGRPWDGSRPTALKLWVKYSAGKMNIIKSQPSGANLSTDSYDRGQIKIALGTWDYKKYGGTKDSPVLVNTTDASTFVDFYTDANTIANGELIVFGNGKQVINNGAETSVANTQWREVIVPINYHTQTAYPTYIVISCAASMYGDYFSGCDTAKLWIDDVELLYE